MDSEMLSSTALFCKEWYAPSIAPDSWRVSRSPSPPSIDEPIEGDVLDFELDLLNADYTSFALATTKPPKMTQPASMPPLPAALEALKPKPPQMPAPMKLPSAPVTRSAKRKLAGTQTPAMLKVKAEPLDEYTPTLEELLEAELTDDEEEKLELKNSIVRVVFVEQDDKPYVPPPPKPQPPLKYDPSKPRARYERFREKQFICDYCDHGFTLKQNVQTHIFNYHLGKNCFEQKRRGKRYECTQCLKVFRTLLQATRHESRAHRKPPPKIVHACNQCHKTYKTPSQLREHYTIAHLNERPFECDECGARFGRAGGLRRHKIFVHTDRTFDCPYEGCTHPGYKCSKALAAHIRSVHTKDRPYVCETCSKAFVRRNDLKMHEQTHNDSASVECPHCGSAFRRTVSLRKHLKICGSN